MMSYLKAPFREFGRRIMACFWLKTFGVPAFMAMFFWGYFWILNHAFFEVTVMPLTAVDRFIPYQNGSWLLYASLWVYVALAPSLIEKHRELILYGCVAAAVSLVGFAIFLLWPTAVPSVALEGVDSSFARIRSLDTTGNSCPSLHVAFSVFTACWMDQLFRKLKLSAAFRWINVVWCVGIVYSTLATKQHVFIDAIAGAMLGVLGAALEARVNAAAKTAVEALPAVPQINPAPRKL